MIAHPNRRRRSTATTVLALDDYDHSAAYAGLLKGVQQTFAAQTRDGARLFCTDATGLYDTYLDNLPGDRQTHTCSACRRFVEAFGGLVTIDESGTETSALWDPSSVPEFYRPAVHALAARVVSRQFRVTAPFLHGRDVLGTPVTGDWSHLSVQGSPVFHHAVLTPGQAMAYQRENRGAVLRALADFKPAALDTALTLLRGEHLWMSERFIAPLAWLRDLYNRPKGRAGDNVVWRAVAAAPEGFCHPRSAMTASLLEDIAAGMPFDSVRARFNVKVGPLAYQRPQAPPSEGNIKAAEALVEKIGLAPSLERRFARLDEVLPHALWTPKAEPARGAGGVFSHLKPKGETFGLMSTPSTSMTWRKFADTVLPSAAAVDLDVPHLGAFIALVTAVNADAPPILKWDREDERNAMSWYVYHNGSPATQWGLRGGWTRVNAVVPLPTMWGPRAQPFLGNGVVLVLDGALDTRTGQGNALFPANMRDELHAIRSTVEAYSAKAELQGREAGSACGYDVRQGVGTINVRLRAQIGGVWAHYTIDRWD